MGTTATTDAAGNATVTVPDAGPITVQVVDQNNTPISKARVVGVSGGAVIVGAPGYIPVVILPSALSTASRKRIGTQSLTSLLVKLRADVCSLANGATGQCLLKGLAETVSTACSVTDPIANGVFSCSPGSSLLSAPNNNAVTLVASAVALNAGTALSAAVNQVIDDSGGSCLVQLLGIDPGGLITSAYANLTSRFYGGQIVNYLSVNAAGTQMLTPFICPTPSGPTATGSVSGGRWMGTLAWSEPNKLFKTEHAFIWSGPTCGNGSSQYDFTTDPTNILTELSQMSDATLSASVPRSVSVSLSLGSYSWWVETIDPDNSKHDSTCVQLNAAAQGGPSPTPAVAIARDDSYSMVQGGVLTVQAPGVLANDTIPAGASGQVEFLPPLPPLPNSGLTNIDDGKGGFTLDLTHSSFTGTVNMPYVIHTGPNATSNQASVSVQVSGAPTNGSWSGSGSALSSLLTSATISMTFQTNGSQISNFAFPWRIDTLPTVTESRFCGGTGMAEGIISGQSFTLGASDPNYSVRITGSFSSSNAVTGLAEFVRTANAAPWCGSATISWNARR